MLDILRMAILLKFRSPSSRTAIAPAYVFHNIIHRASSLVLLLSCLVVLLVVVVLPPPVAAASTTFGGGDVGGNSSSSSSSAAFVARPSRGGGTTQTTTPMKLLPTSATFMKRSSTPPSPRQMRMRSSFSSPGAGAGDGDGEGGTTTTKTSSSSSSSAMRDFYRSLSSSWIDHLSPESPENYERSIARVGRGAHHPGRPVFNGHYVEVRPTPLKNPILVIHSPETMSELGCFGPGAENSEGFARYFAGDVDVAVVDVDMVDVGVRTWATPYALSIMGRRYTNNCPYGTGDGYGDGRAISVGEIPIGENDDGGKDGRGGRLELQLKGAGRTAFCRGADGRAVLRSSIREFLGSEAMHHLGVSTTRALCLVTSDGPDGDTSRRPWYSSGGGSSRDDNYSIPNVDDPRLSRFDLVKRREIISQLRASTRSDPDVIVEERCAITTRVAPSFVRIGHLDLFARRVDSLMERTTDDDDDDDDDDNEDVVDDDSGRKKTAFGLPSMPNEGSREDRKKRKIARTTQYRELEDMMWHACYREYHDEAYAPHAGGADAISAATALMEGAMVRIANMVGGWIRVGFVQGNFNADNCLVGGRTMDYGPFGFLDVYHPLAAKWTGSGDHFGFMNQPSAGYANFAVLVESLLPIIDVNGGDVNEVRDEVLKRGQSVFSDAVNEALRSKMGLAGGLPDAMTRDADELWEEIEPLLRIARGDWTLFWRQLTYVAARYSPAASARQEQSCSDDSPDYDGMMAMLLGEGDTNPFYDALDDNNRDSLRKWIVKWHVSMTACYQYAAGQSKDVTPPEEIMRLANPKYTLREWMLVEAYTKADPGKSPGNPFSISGDYSGIHELFRLCKDPYGEGTADDHQKYYRRAPDESLRAGGTAFMS